MIFGVLLLLSVLLNLRKRESDVVASDGLAERLHLSSQYLARDGQMRPFEMRRVPLAGLRMFIAGILSGLLGIGSGALKVLALDDVMGLPFKVSATTCTFMIGVTATASAGLYLRDDSEASSALATSDRSKYAGASELRRPRSIESVS